MGKALQGFISELRMVPLRMGVTSDGGSTHRWCPSGPAALPLQILNPRPCATVCIESKNSSPVSLTFKIQRPQLVSHGSWTVCQPSVPLHLSFVKH